MVWLAMSSSNITDQSALFAIKFGIKFNPTNVLAHNWTTSTSFYNNFTGGIPEELGMLLELRYLFLGENYNLLGTIPLSLGNITKLEYLVVERSRLTGSIPFAIFNLSSLLCIFFPHLEDLNGSIAEAIRSLPKIETFYIGNNKIAGTIPPSLDNISSLVQLYLGDGHIHGNIPNDLGRLSKLIEFNIEVNYLTRATPQEIFNISLQSVCLDFSDLSGNLPKIVGLRLPNLMLLQLQNNQLGGNIAAYLSNSSRLTGSLENLVVEDNQFNGILPNSIGNRTSPLLLFAVSNCQTIGHIPRGIGYFENLNILFLANNGLTGTIPSTIGKLQSLQRLHLNGNKMEGIIPNELCLLKKLGELSLQNNGLSGPIPPCIGNISLLQKVLLGSNALNSSIPVNLWSLENLIVLNLSSNNFGGSLPLNTGKLEVIKNMDLSRNKFLGNISPFIGAFLLLRSLNQSRNSFEGIIPQSFGDLIALESIDLSYNNLSSSIPKSLEKLRYLSYLNLSFNKLYGEIPSGGPFANFTAKSFLHNEALCGSPYLQVPSCNHGSFGSVYRGMLSDGTDVVVKILNLQVDGAFRSFDAECQVLRTIRHRNLVKVISSCSNPEVRALVLKCMPNGSLEKWLYSHNYCLNFFQWVSIMLDVALALEYLHHGQSEPIVHCDLNEAKQCSVR
ncbi:receptor kinase-like protein Xa21 [Camellia sinensis]|uniref:receptor kinase-like protein Xa21 n=1 Tax=Camellia sinensis TaxID=4442 RepID=UPI001036B338|nr:receptor kinase-like protein Xa21 [Camellia sinensis]